MPLRPGRKRSGCAAKAWRFDTATYAGHLGLSGVSATSAADDDQTALQRLRELYAQHRVPLHEEALLDQLTRDPATVGP